MRGKAILLCLYCIKLGITPAYAGKSGNSSIYSFWLWDHPRVCGEKDAMAFKTMLRQGSPPRMRGKDDYPGRGNVHPGITPAYAGKSNKPDGCGIHIRDHPRVCGEKWILSGMSRPVLGSPPRMRGKGDCTSWSSYWYGITPAYAGKSNRWNSCVGIFRDHPRVCGEKILRITPLYTLGGSPPRMRGKVG